MDFISWQELKTIPWYWFALGYLTWISGGFFYVLRATKDQGLRLPKKEGFLSPFSGLIEDLKEQPVAATAGYMLAVLIGGWAMFITDHMMDNNNYRTKASD